MPATRATNPFTGVDLVNYPGKNYNVEQIIYLIKQIQSKKIDVTQVLKTRPISPKTLRRWVKNVENGEAPRQKAEGSGCFPRKVIRG